MEDKMCFKVYAYETVDIKEKVGVPDREEILKSHVRFDEGDDKTSKKVPLAKSRFNTEKSLKSKHSKSTNNLIDLSDKDCLIF